jgi:hypothetical protein
MKQNTSIVVVCEDKVCRDQAVKFCDELVKRFWTQCEFEITWLSFDDLAAQNGSRNAAEKARSAQILIMSMNPAPEAPAELQAWSEAWLAQRGEREGYVIGLGDPGHVPGGGVSRNFVYTRDVAHRAGMDYLTELPIEMRQAIPESLDCFCERAEQHSSVLDQILARKVPAVFRS